MQKKIIYNPLAKDDLQYIGKITTGTVATAAATADKEVTIAGYTPTAGDVLCITYTLGTSAGSPTLNINGGGKISIYLGSTAASATTHSVGANGEIMYYYDGTNLQMFGSMRTSDNDIAKITTLNKIGSYDNYAILDNGYKYTFNRNASNVITSVTKEEI
jgi:hypothetical protein